MRTFTSHSWSAVLVLALAVLMAPKAFAPTDSQPPALFVTTSNCQVTTNSTMAIAGYATDDVALKNLIIFTGTQAAGYAVLANVALSGRSNSWAISVPLSQGMNYFLIQVYDRSNKSQCVLFTTDTTMHASCCQFYVVYDPTNTTRIPFEMWRQAHFTPAELLDPAISGPDADPDGDGMVNLLEYAWNRNPKSADSQTSTIVPGITPFGGGGYFQMTYFVATNIEDILYTPELSFSLANPLWLSNAAYLTPAVTVATNGALAEVQTRSTSPISTQPSTFGRVAVVRRPFVTLDDLVPTLTTFCYTCHAAGGSSGIPWFDGDLISNLVNVPSWTDENVPRITAGFPECSELYQRLISSDPNYRMPYMRQPLSPDIIEKVKYWIETGAIHHGPALTTSIVGGGIITANGNGTIQTNPAAYYPFDTTVLLTAYASSNWVFNLWSGDTNGMVNPLTIVMTTNKSVTANFTAAPDVTEGTMKSILVSPPGGIHFYP